MNPAGRPRVRPAAPIPGPGAATYRGVQYRCRERAYVARIDITVGYFGDPIEAARVRDAKVRELGLRTPLNFPDESGVAS